MSLYFWIVVLILVYSLEVLFVFWAAGMTIRALRYFWREVVRRPRP